MATPKEHVQAIRKTKFSIGGEPNPLTEDLHQAVKNLSAELYAKDVHFLMELIQNAEDNEYDDGVDPSLEFVITSRDITEMGAPATLLIFNNEKGFSEKNVDSICSVGRSTKKGNRKRGYIGEKGIGFKSVFLITARPYIFSKGYQICFNEEPCHHCGLGYIVPEWVDENPILSEVKKIYGSTSALPTTFLILPLKPDKVKPVKAQLSCIHPEILLFLSKIKCLTVREDNEDPRLNTVNAIAISSETNFVQRKNFDAESYTLHLAADESSAQSETACSYYMWKQRFPVPQEYKVDRRNGVEEWVITLAFPQGERTLRGGHSPGIYAFLPTEMVTNFPFIIQADFLLASSRETILLDNKWNQGILGCVPLAFVNAFFSLVKTTADAPMSNLPPMFRFLPVTNSRYQELNDVRESIRAKLIEEEIVPCEPVDGQKVFCKPQQVGRIMPAFWSLINKARKHGVSLSGLSSHGKFILSYSFDRTEYDHVLNFLGVELVSSEWYARCIQGSNLVEGVSEDLYLQILLFVADKWKSIFWSTNMLHIPLIKHGGQNGHVSVCSINESKTKSFVYLSRQSNQVSWLINCNGEFRSVTNFYFIPEITQQAIWSFQKRETLMEWLKDHVGVGFVDVNEYAILLNEILVNCNRSYVVSFAHFLYHSLSKDYLFDVSELASNMPLVDRNGYVSRSNGRVLVPSNGSKWVGLLVSNLWKDEGYVELGEDYFNPGHFAGEYTPKMQLIRFLKSYASASDVPVISAPNARIPTVSGPLTKENAFLLLEWIRYLKESCIPEKFLISIKEGNWLKITLDGCPGFRPPSQSFVLTSSLGNILQNGSVLVDIPLVDENYYGDINKYKEELKTVGVMFEYSEACAFIGKRLMSLVRSSTFTKNNVFSILNFIKFLRVNFFATNEFISSIREGRWLRTYRGDRSPSETVLFSDEWRVAEKISNIPFIDQDYLGGEISSFRSELGLLGVVVSSTVDHQLVIDHLKPASCLASLTVDTFLLLLECMRHLPKSSGEIAKALKSTKCIKTIAGYKSPPESLLCDTNWECLLRVFSGHPLIDQNFYGNKLLPYRNELKEIGVMMDFEEAAKAFAFHFKGQASNKSISKENVISFLSCYRGLKGSQKFPSELKKCIREEKWLRTRLGDFRPPSECILFGPEWESISRITLLPFIDDSFNWYGKDIYGYKDDLKMMGVVVNMKDGAEFVINCLYLPQNPSCIGVESALSLLNCIRDLLQKQNYSFPETFLSKAWLKTHAGYRSPDKCLLFDSKWSLYLKQSDGPFIDEGFYGSNIASYKRELSALGVIIDVEKGCPLVANYLDCLQQKISVISRIYKYLSVFKWEPESDASRRIWIPNGSNCGRWVNPDQCVVSDKNGLFSSKLIVLENYYEDSLLVFFSLAFGVKSSPSIDDYLELWKFWESSGNLLSNDECCKFWKFVSGNWNSNTEKRPADLLLKVPVRQGPDGIALHSKCDVFIADDLQLKDLFEQCYPNHPIFVWYPQPSLPSLPRNKLLEHFQKIGVKTISESVKKEEMPLDNGVQQEQLEISRGIFIPKGLLTLILGFLADPSIDMEADKRHKAVQGLLSISVIEMIEPITVSYNVSLSSGEHMNVKATRMIRWDRASSKLFAQRLDRSKGPKHIVEFGTYFSQVISEGVLWENRDHIDALSELIKVGFLLEFDEEAIAFLMKSKNLQILMEDDKFLSSTFPSN